MYFDIIFRRVDFPLPFLPTITFTPGLNINSEPFLNAFIFGIYLNGVFLLSSILIEVIILYDFVLNYLSLSLIAKSNILSRHFLISAAPMIAFRFPNESHEVMNPLTSASRPEYRLGNWTGSLAIKSAVPYLSAMHFGMSTNLSFIVYPFICSHANLSSSGVTLVFIMPFKQGHCRQTIS